MTAGTAAAIAGGVSAAASVGSAIAGATASGDAAGALQAGARQNLHLYNQQKPINDQLLQQSQGQNDQLLSQSQGQNDQLLQGATRYGQRKIQHATDYGRDQLRAALQYGQDRYRPYANLGQKGNAALGRYLGFTPQYNGKKPVAPTAPAKGDKNALAQYAKAKATYKTKLAAYNQDKAAYLKDQRGKGDFGDYFRPYTQADLNRDPVYQTELNENVRAWDQSAASRGSLMSGNTVAGLRDLTAAGIQRGYDRDWDQRQRKYGALTGLSTMGQNVAGQLTNLRTGIAANQVANQHWGTNAFLQNNQWGTGLRVNNNQWGTGLRVNNNQWGTGNRLQNNQWAIDGATGANTAGANAQANGAMSQGNAWANGMDNIGYLAMRYGSGAFGNQPYTLGGPGTNKPFLTVSG